MQFGGVDTSISRGAVPDGMVIKSTGKPPKQRSVYRLSGVSQPTEFGVHNNNLCNLRRGLLERVYYVEGRSGLQPPPQPEPGRFAEVFDKFVDALSPHLPSAAPCTADEFVSMYDGDRRRKVYAAAAESLVSKPVSRDDARLSTFVKAEKINFTAKVDPAPRVIQPRGPRYNVEVGRYLKRLEKPIYKAIEGLYGEPTVLKGYNAGESGRLLRAKWDQYDKPVAIGLDASRFDQHCSEAALKAEHSVYLKCFRGKDRKRLATLLSWQLRNRGIGRANDGLIKYTVNGCRMSGDMNTALGNCLLMSGMVWALLDELGVKGSLANNGDDCVVIMESRDLTRFQAAVELWFLRLGFTMKVEEPVYVFEQIEFCQTKPVWGPHGWVMCRKGLVAMAKDSVSVLPLSDRGAAQRWAAAIGNCGMALAGGLPIFQEYYQALLSAAGNAADWKHPALESGFARLASGMHHKYGPISAATRISFWEAFGVLPSEQEWIETRLRDAQVHFGIHRRDKFNDFSFLSTTW